MKKILGIAVILTGLLSSMALTSSCKSHKESVVTVQEEKGNTPSRSDYDTFVNGFKKWQKVRVPVTLRLNQPMSISVGGTATMVAGKSLHMSFSFLGMEVLKLYVTSDSIYGSYKFNKIYFAESVPELLADFPANVGNVQDLLMGRPFMAGAGTLTSSDFKKVKLLSTGSQKGFYIMMPSVKGIDYGFSVTQAGKISGVTVTAPKYDPVTCAYSDFVSTIAGSLASKASVIFRADGTKIDGSLELNWKKAKWGDDVPTVGWTTPRGYKRVKASSILNSLSF